MRDDAVEVAREPVVKPGTGHIRSRMLAMAAVALWLISLSQPALIIDNGTGKPALWSGLSVLATGWMGFGLASAAWYANPPFLYAVYRLLVRDAVPWVAAIASLLLALDTFRLEVLPGGGRADVYAYGAGVAVWIASLGVLSLAVAWREKEVAGAPEFRNALRAPKFLTVLVAMSIFIGAFAYQAYRTTQSPSVTEAEFLSLGAVKRGALCMESVAPADAVLHLDGPLAVDGNAYPFSHIVTLLRWGIPAVRKGDFDYALAEPGDLSSIYWIPATGAASSVLRVATETIGGREVVEAALESADGRLLAFRQRWARDIRKSSLYCPDFRPNDQRPDAQPRALLVAALDLPRGLHQSATAELRPALHMAPYRRENLPRAAVLDIEEDGTVDQVAPNPGCGSLVGLVADDRGAAQLGPYGGQQIFALDGRRYLLTERQPLHAVCLGEDVFLYYFWRGMGSSTTTLYLQRRTADRFRPLWTMAMAVAMPPRSATKGVGDLRIRSMRVDKEILTAELVDVDGSRVVTVAIPSPGTKP